MAKTPRVHMTSDEVAPVVPTWFRFDAGTLAANKTWKFAAPFAGCIHDKDHVILAWDKSGAAAAKRITGSLTDVDGDDFFTTSPSFLGSAANEGSTLLGGAGITQGILAELALRSFTAGEILIIGLAESVAASDPTGVSITVGLTPFQDKDPDIRVAVS